ncbi:LysM peptidoglycan-binding domain-containing protein [Streptomyces sp. LHD-70]|uniref:LysM peptidoglycan-binding domain-containing protein n=1 Tax=Streptomyces sp. LHD-70 TaxID=3072140 RepID=UPI00280F8936|nr:LysM peptidoglycan-binding domain-containing protein [Streptomyces sp. LHD-70]MDQ8707523.1 LysM peptidoglycan-binding domain-containing protein [Streptomyces sp. LHD-70]
MHPSPAPLTPWPLAWLRRLLALAALAGLLAGVPLLLLEFGTLPVGVPSMEQAQDALSGPDDGTLLMTVLTLSAWLCWLWLAIPVIAEVAAVAARKTTPRLPGMGTGQRLAGFLLGSIILASPAAAASAATPAVAVTASHAQAPESSSAHTAAPAGQHGAQGDLARQAASPAPVRPQSDAVAQYTVPEGGATWWDLAERLLGDGLRYGELQSLNSDLPTTSVLPAGTVVSYPGTSAAAQTTEEGEGPRSQLAAAEAVSADEGSTYTVENDDSLWGISEERYGDGTKYKDIAAANQNVIDDPALIYPGQKLQLPTLDDSETGGAGSPAQREPAEPAEPEAPRPAPDRTEAPQESATPGGEQEGEGSPESQAPGGHGQDDEETSTPPPSETPAPEETEEPEEGGAATPSAPPTTIPAGGADDATPTTPRPGSEETSPGTDRDGATATDEEDSSLVAEVLALSGAGVLAAGVVTMLARRRVHQQRERARGRRIAMPQGGAADTEARLRSVNVVTELAHLDVALRTAALEFAEQQRPLPDLIAVQLGAEGAVLHLSEPAPPVAPFTAEPEHHQVWWCPADSTELRAPEETGEVDAPYPGLVALGEDGNGGIVLVDLERFGALHLTGSLREGCFRALAVSLALSPLAGQMEVLVAGDNTAPGLTLLDSERVSLYDDLDQAVRAVAAHHDEQQQALAGAGVEDLTAARPVEEVAELAPMVLLADLDACGEPDAEGQLWEVLQQTPRTAVAVITSSEAALEEAAHPVWVVDTDNVELAVPGTPVRCVVAACSTEEYADVVELALTSSSPDVPAPADTEVLEPAAAGPAPVSAQDDSPSDTYGLPSATPSRAASDDVPAGAEEPVRARTVLAGLAELGDDLEEVGELHGPEESEPEEELAAADNSVGADEADTPSLRKDEPNSAEASGAPPAGEAQDLPAAAAGPGDVVLPTAVPTPRVTARLPELPAPAQGAAGAGPRVRVMGTVTVEGARGTIQSNRLSIALELAAWLALHPGATSQQIIEVLAPNGRLSRNVHNTRLNELRRWLGASADGTRHLPHVNSQPDRKYRLMGVECDWLQFQCLVSDGLTQPGQQGQRLLHDALALVEGRPFAGIPPHRYTWAEPLVQDMIAEIVDVAEELGERCLADHDPRGALWAAARGLGAAREVESLWRIRFRSLHLLGENEELRAAIAELETLLIELGTSMHEETAETLRMLQAAHR